MSAYEFVFKKFDDEKSNYAGENLYISSQSEEIWTVEEDAFGFAAKETEVEGLDDNVFGFEDLPNTLPAEYEFTGFMEEDLLF